MNIRLTSLCVFLLLFAVGCQSTQGAGDSQNQDQSQSQSQSQGQSQGAGQAGGQSDQQGTSGSALPSQSMGTNSSMAGGQSSQSTQPSAGQVVDYLDYRTLYFDFDRSDLRPEHQAIIEAHARFLAENPGSKLRLEGHADERGSREYNIGLGERRAQTIRRAMALQGASSTQLSTLSYGEEKPAVTGHDEWSWQQNRRVELVYH